MANYKKARSYTETLLEKEPNNPQAKSLMKQIDDKVRCTMGGYG